jgi:hypothetical protein
LKNDPAIEIRKVKNFDKIKENIKNINKYRKTRGMVSPKKSNSQYSNSNNKS